MSNVKICKPVKVTHVSSTFLLYSRPNGEVFSYNYNFGELLTNYYNDEARH